MSIIFFDGFEKNTALTNFGWGGLFGYDGTYIENARYPGGHTVQFEDVGHFYRNIFPQDNTLIIGAAIYAASSQAYTTFNSIFAVYSEYNKAGEIVFRLGWRESTKKLYFIDSFGREVETQGVFNLGTWNYLEVKYKLGDTDGVIHIRLNEEDIYLEENITTISKTKTMRSLRVGALTLGNNQRTWFDDIYIADGVNNQDFIGDCRVVTVYPNGDTAQKDFVPSSGTINYSQLSENSFDDDSSYVRGINVGDKDEYELSNMPPDVIVPLAIQPFIRAKAEIPISRINTFINSNEIIVNSGPKELGSSYETKIMPPIDRNPDGNTLWTISDLDELKIGFEIV